MPIGNIFHPKRELERDSILSDKKDNMETIEDCAEFEIEIERKATAIAGLMRYVDEHQDLDPLVTGFKDPSVKNPYKREKLNKCSILFFML